MPPPPQIAPSPNGGKPGWLQFQERDDLRIIRPCLSATHRFVSSWILPSIKPTFNFRVFRVFRG